MRYQRALVLIEAFYVRLLPPIAKEYDGERADLR